VKRTGAGALVIAAVLGAGAGFLIDQLLTAAGRATFNPTIALSLLLVAIGVIIVALAIPIRRATRGTSTAPVDPFRALRIAVLSKASSLVGAALGGVGVGMLLFLLTRPVAPSLGSVGTVVTLVVSAALLMVAGLVAEQLCTIRKDDDDEQPGPDDSGFTSGSH